MVFKNRKAFKSGFTLMELMVVIAIIAIVSSVSIPSMMASLPDYQLRRAARDIISLLQETKLRAVKENATAAIIFNVPGNSYTAWVDNGWGGGANNWWPDTNVGEVVFQQDSLPTGINFYINTTFPSNTFGFNSRGMPAIPGGVGGTVYINNNKSNFRRIVVNRAGNIRVQKSSDGITWN